MAKTIHAASFLASFVTGIQISTDLIKLNITNSSSFHFLESLDNISFKQHFANQSRCTLILWQIAFINVFHQPKLTKKKRLLEGKNFLKLSSCKDFWEENESKCRQIEADWFLGNNLHHYIFFYRIMVITVNFD